VYFNFSLHFNEGNEWKCQRNDSFVSCLGDYGKVKRKRKIVCVRVFYEKKVKKKKITSKENSTNKKNLAPINHRQTRKIAARISNITNYQTSNQTKTKTEKKN
jgi:hypothetical protein